MKKVVYLVLLACVLTGGAAFALELRQPQAKNEDWSTATINTTSITITAFSLTNGTVLLISPIAREPVYKHINGTRRKLSDFRECSPCTCCDSTRRWCLPTVCCYDINCGVRGLPFGLCSFTPISCTCLGCRD